MSQKLPQLDPQRKSQALSNALEKMTVPYAWNRPQRIKVLCPDCGEVLDAKWNEGGLVLIFHRDILCPKRLPRQDVAELKARRRSSPPPSDRSLGRVAATCPICKGVLRYNNGNLGCQAGCTAEGPKTAPGPWRKVSRKVP